MFGNMLELSSQIATFSKRFEALILLMQMSHAMIKDLHASNPQAATPESVAKLAELDEKFAALTTDGGSNVA